MPVKSHWAAWDGGAQLVVATALRDHEVPVGYRLDGTAYVFTSAYDPPAIPVLAIVPRETDFGAGPSRVEDPILPDCFDACEGAGGGGGGGGGGGSTPLPAGIYMTFSYIPGDYEGFLMGDPEFEVHVMARRTALDTGGTDVQCAGEHAATSGNQQGYKSTNYTYDQNGSTWTGSVMLFSQAQIVAAQSIDSATAYWVWEDDNDDCKIVKKDQDVADYVKSLAPIVLGGYNAVKAVFTSGGNPVLEAIALGGIVLKMLNVFSNWQNDDIVGVMVREDAVSQNYSDATHAIVTKTGQIAGRANLIVRNGQ